MASATAPSVPGFIGTHSVDLIRYLLGPIVEVLAVPTNINEHLGVEDTVHLFVRTRGGTQASVDLSWSLGKVRPSYVDIYGARGRLSVGWKQSQLLRNGASEWENFGSGYDKVAALSRVIHNFCHAVAGDEPARVTAEDALASVEVIEKAYESLESKTWVSVEESPEHPTERAPELRSV